MTSPPPNAHPSDELRLELERLRSRTRILKRVALALFAIEVLGIALFFLLADQVRYMG